ncbi:ABC transporter permease [Variovorax sp. J31P207]|uniref:ABC transporter permease n=1 Tax=Variovorax sp. J31P207 TaxID=3053510 RepID=UPI0025772C34|nr:ABC transporter permease [Variovorax sp. J31P207]MDM0071507.1 ABC transporter permease [Variovorax sp. J31P207]
MKSFSSSFLLRVGLLVGMTIVFSIASESFLTLGNMYALAQGFALLGLVTLGLALTMIAGEFDLSVGAVVAVAGLVMVKTGEAQPLLGIALAVGAGVLVGIANSILTLKLSVSSLVTTLGVMILLRGVAVWIEGGQVVSYANFDASDLLDSKIAQVLSPRSLITCAAFVALAVLLRFTRFGRDIYATGSRRKAAVMSGARVPASVYIVFGLSGGFAALAGALMSISLATASAQFGSNLLLQAATAAILGGVALSGGVGKPGAIAGGVLVLSVLNNGLSLVGAASPTVLLLNGAVLLLVVLIDGDLRKLIGSALQGHRARQSSI